jgi:glycosyltransferase involved in cell wall biosynthesis
MGGMQRHSFNLARGLARLGVEVDLYHSDFKDAVDIEGLEGMAEAEKLKITSIAIPWPKKFRLPGHYIRELKRFSYEVLAVYQGRPKVDFIYGQGLTAWAFAEEKRGGMDLPPIGVNFHGLEMFQAAINLKIFLQNRMMKPAFGHHARQADYVLSLGGRLTQITNEVIGVPRQRILEIPGGVDYSWLHPDPTPEHPLRRFIFVGRYERRKGIEELHAAIRQHPKWHGRAEFRFVGPIPKDKQLRLPHVSYAGAVHGSGELQAELRSADVLLCPSHSEGMPTVIMEGMAAGLAVLATDVGAVSLLVSEGNGCLIDRLTIPALACGIDHLLTIPGSELLSLKQSSLRRIPEFTWDSIARKNLIAIESILARR